jgi:hypothetical protein
MLMGTMQARRLAVAAAVAALLGLPAAGRSQWVRLQRCQGALPCAIPFGVRYSPDPLISSQYGFISPDAFSGRITFSPELHVQLDTPGPPLNLESRDFAAEAARRFILSHPRPPAAPTPNP